MSRISRAAASDDVYELVELSYLAKQDPVALAQIVEALQESIPRLDPVRYRGELEHVLNGPDLPELEAAKELAKAALEGGLMPGRAPDEAGEPGGGSPLLRGARLLWGWRRTGH